MCSLRSNPRRRKSLPSVQSLYDPRNKQSRSIFDKPESPTLTWHLYTFQLPEDVLRDIFELASSINSTCLQLMLVSRTVKSWVEHLIYTVIPRSKSKGFIESISVYPKTLSFYTKYVKAIHIGVTSGPDIRRLLVNCRGLTNLCIWTNVENERALGPAEFQDLLDGMSIKRLSISLRAALDLKNESPNFGLPLFHSITHLEIIDAMQKCAHWRGFEAMPRLTHLSLYGYMLTMTKAVLESYPVKEFVEAILSNCRALEVLVVLLEVGSGEEFVMISGLKEIKDPRLVLVKPEVIWEDDWHAGAIGQETVLGCAEEVVTLRCRS